MVLVLYALLYVFLIASISEDVDSFHFENVLELLRSSLQ
jgi:hypothetical protein